MTREEYKTLIPGDLLLCIDSGRYEHIEKGNQYVFHSFSPENYKCLNIMYDKCSKIDWFSYTRFNLVKSVSKSRIVNNYDLY